MQRKELGADARVFRRNKVTLCQYIERPERDVARVSNGRRGYIKAWRKFRARAGFTECAQSLRVAARRSF